MNKPLSMLERFQGDGGRERLVEALAGQTLVRGDNRIAERFASRVTVMAYPKGDELIRQGGADNTLYLILAGAVAIEINRRDLARRHAGEHVGEMSILDPGSPRSATVIAVEETIVAVISEAEFSRIAQEFPIVWRHLAAVLGDRLRQRTRYVRFRNEVPRVFIGSSRESLPIAVAVQEALPASQIVTKLWSEGVFGASRFPIDDLEREVAAADFGILVLGADDKVFSRGRDLEAPRDNVVFELGLVMGACGRKRAYLVVPRGTDVKIPTDLLGLTPVCYDAAARTPHDAVIDACATIGRTIMADGPR